MLSIAFTGCVLLAAGCGKRESPPDDAAAAPQTTAESAPTEPAKPETAITASADPLALVEAKNELDAIRRRIVEQKGLTPTIVAELASLHRRYPQDDHVSELLIRGHEQFQNWSELADVLSEIPVSRRTLAQQVELGDALIRAHRYEEAFAHLDPLFESHSDNPEIAGLTADAAFHVQRYDRAASLRDRFAEYTADIGDIRADYQRAMIYIENAQHDQAVAILSALVKKVPSHIGGHEALGKALLAKGETQVGQEHVQAAQVLRSRLTRPEELEQRMQELAQLMLAAWEKARYADCEKYIAQMLPNVTGEERAVVYNFQANVFNVQGKADQARAALRMAELEMAAVQAARSGGSAPSEQQSP